MVMGESASEVAGRSLLYNSICRREPRTLIPACGTSRARRERDRLFLTCGETAQSFRSSNQRLRRVGGTSCAFARLPLPEKLLIHTERCEMRRDLCVLAGICVLLAAPASMSQSDPQRPAESPRSRTGVPTIDLSFSCRPM